MRDALNAVLRPDPISVLACETVAADFDARFGAKARHYLYRIVDRRSPLALERNRAWGVFRPLDAKAMDRTSCLPQSLSSSLMEVLARVPSSTVFTITAQ